MTEEKQIQALQNKLNATPKTPRTRYLTIGLLVAIAILGLVMTLKSTQATTYKQALDNLVVEFYVDERRELTTVVEQIVNLRSRKQELCDLLPVEVRNEWERKICG